MSAAAPADWLDRNQVHLSAALERVATQLRRHLGDGPDDEPVPADLAPKPALDPASDPTLDGMVPNLHKVATAFGLTPFEQSILVLCAGVELDTGLASLCARANGDPASTHATLGLALEALPDAHWTALTPAAPLRWWRLVELEDGPLTTCRLHIDEWTLHYLTGVDFLDERLRVLSHPTAHPRPLIDSHRSIADHLCRLWPGPLVDQDPTVACLFGRNGSANRAVAHHACDRLGLQLVSMAARAMPVEPERIDGFARLWTRQAVLSGAALMIELSDSDEAAATAAVRTLVETASFPVLLVGRDRWRGTTRSAVNVEVTVPTRAEQRGMWADHLGDLPGVEQRHIDDVARHFSLDGERIAAATRIAAAGRVGNGVEEAENRVDNDDGDRIGDGAEAAALLWNAARDQARPELDDLASRIVPRARWDDLVLPDFQKSLLEDIVRHVEHRDVVHDDWGFADRTGRGLGISALFVGQSGTGKTTAAEVIAGKLGLDLYRVDLSQVVSKYIGETEKNLRRVFDAAEDCGAILLFDEADALFGKRSEVRDSHDRYANIEVSYLLQRMESYRGLAILTTNMDGAIDSAFMRRLRFVIEFGFPDAEQRAEIWRTVLPARTPRGKLAYDRLAQLSLTGGNIANIALGASFLAAHNGQRVEMTHLARAAQTEYAKLGRSLAPSELRGWT